jgi:hypothetical protein
VIQQSLPRSCATGLSSDTGACYSRVIPQPGNYTLTVRAVVDCDAPNANCTCDLGEAACTDPYRTFTFPSDSYFQNQVLNIAAP